MKKSLIHLILKLLNMDVLKIRKTGFLATAKIDDFKRFYGMVDRIYQSDIKSRKTSDFMPLKRYRYKSGCQTMTKTLMYKSVINRTLINRNQLPSMQYYVNQNTSMYRTSIGRSVHLVWGRFGWGQLSAAIPFLRLSAPFCAFCAFLRSVTVLLFLH